MPAAYDNYDYPSYWKGREYEHKAEVLAIKSLISKIPHIKKCVEIGAGFARLLPAYIFRAKSITLTDPSSKLLSIARKKYKQNKKIEFTQASLETFSSTTTNKYDLCIMVRVLHHIPDIDEALDCVYKILQKNGYLILEFANKNNLKASIRQFLRGNFTYPIDIFPIDIRSKKNIKKNTLPFVNFHPDLIKEKLKMKGFEIIETRSVSNIRSSFIKKLFPMNFLLDLEKILQVPLSNINFGPSIFILAKKTD